MKQISLGVDRMILYLKAKTPIPDPVIDYIEVRLKSGETVSLNWNWSNISRTHQGFDAEYSGVCFGESKEFLSVFILWMEFREEEKSLEFASPTVIEEGGGYGDQEKRV